MIAGASNTRQFFSIRIPLLGPVLQMVLMNAMLGSLKVTDLILTLTPGGPVNEPHMMLTYVYGKFVGGGGAGSLGANNWGYAAACTVVTALILAAVTLIYLRVTKKSADVY